MTKVLTELDEIRAWTAGRGGNPILADMPGVGGKDQSLLGLTFDQHMLNADANEGPDRPGGHTNWWTGRPGMPHFRTRVSPWSLMTILKATPSPGTGS